MVLWLGQGGVFKFNTSEEDDKVFAVQGKNTVFKWWRRGCSVIRLEGQGGMKWV